MIRYLKYIVIVFGTIGISVAGFFAFQNRVDLGRTLDYRSIIDYDYLKTHCLKIEKEYYYPCLKIKYEEFLEGVSLTGTNMGLRMMFSVMEEDKQNAQYFKNSKHRNLAYTLNYLEVNNMTMENAYQRYFGLSALYGGFLASLREYYTRAEIFSEDLLAGFESPKGISSLEDQTLRSKLMKRFRIIRADYYRIKQEASDFIEIETARIKKI